jgi:acetyl esterase
MSSNLLNFLRWLLDKSAWIIGPRFYAVETNDVILKNIKIRVYKPASNKPIRPVIIYYHGGAWIIGSIKSYDRVLRYLCHRTDCIVVAVEYRKAPEYKFPTALEDAYSGYQWIVANISKMQGDIKRLIFSGDSAGGNLAIGLLKRLDNQRDIIPCLIILIYPLLETRITSGKKRQSNNLIYRLIYKLSSRILEHSLGQYLTSDDQRSSSSIAHLDNFDQHMLHPPTLVITAEYDALTPGINQYAQQLASIGTEVRVKEYPKMLHGFINFSGVSKQAKTALDDIADYVQNNID